MLSTMARYLCSVTCHNCGHSVSWEQDIPSDVYLMEMECLKCGFVENFVEFHDALPRVDKRKMERILGQLTAEDIGLEVAQDE